MGFNSTFKGLSVRKLDIRGAVSRADTVQVFRDAALWFLTFSGSRRPKRVKACPFVSEKAGSTIVRNGSTYSPNGIVISQKT